MRRLQESGTDATVEESAAAEKINESYVSRVLRLTLLAPDIVEPILGGWVAAGRSAARGPNAAVSSRLAEQRIDILSSVRSRPAK
jgi:hypothetical protein